MNGKTWIRVFVLTFFALATPVVVINYTIDPLLNFSHTNALNRKFEGFNERQQKTNYILNHHARYEGIILGSSRTTFINQNDFAGMQLFNYASSAMWPFEYQGYIDYVRQLKGGALKAVVIGGDFYGIMEPLKIEFEKPESYIARALDPLDPFRNLLSIDTFKYSLRTLRLNLRSKYRMYYERSMVKVQKKVEEKEFLARYTKNLIRHTKEFSEDNYRDNSSYFENLRQLKAANPGTKFIYFTSPVSADLFASILINNDRFEEYRRWIRGVVDVFGEVYCFMGINSITTHLENYPDDDHFYPAIGKILATKIATGDFDTEPKDFGTVVNAGNVEAFLAEELEKVRRYRFSDVYPKDQF